METGLSITGQYWKKKKKSLDMNNLSIQGLLTPVGRNTPFDLQHLSLAMLGYCYAIFPLSVLVLFHCLGIHSVTVIVHLLSLRCLPFLMVSIMSLTPVCRWLQVLIFLSCDTKHDLLHSGVECPCLTSISHQQQNTFIKYSFALDCGLGISHDAINFSKSCLAKHTPPFDFQK